MNSPPSYRNNVEYAVRYFRPILSSLEIRKKNSKRIFLTDFEYLDLLELDNFVLYYIVADIGDTAGMFLCRQKENAVFCYIIVNEKLYTEENLEKVKVNGVHEFCHFMALIYAYTATTTTIDARKDYLIKRLTKKREELDTKSLDNLYSSLCSKEKSSDSIPEMNDTHFRLDFEGETLNYDTLFEHLLFSKELFELFFDNTAQHNFKKLMESNHKDENEKGINLFCDALVKASKEKSVPFTLAWKQALTFVKEYLV